jgi:hypothetical protein
MELKPPRVRPLRQRPPHAQVVVVAREALAPEPGSGAFTVRGEEVPVSLPRRCDP